MTQNQKRAEDFMHRLVLLTSAADGYGCKDQTHRSAEREKWWPVSEALEKVWPLVKHIEDQR